MFGQNVLAKWGNPLWGERSISPAANFNIDANLKGTSTSSFLVNSLASAVDTNKIFRVNSVIRSTADSSFFLDAYVSRLDTSYKQEVTKPILLLEIDLPSGYMYLAPQDIVVGGVQYLGRLVSAGEVLRSLTSGTDELSIDLDDTSERGSRFRDLFRANDPEGSAVKLYLSLRDGAPQNRVPLFDGRIDQVSGFSHSTVSIDVLRNEAVADKQLGRPVTQSEYPKAPPEYLSKMIPIVYGTHDTHEGVAVRVNAVSRLAVRLPAAQSFIYVPPAAVSIRSANQRTPSNTYKSSNTIVLEDASGFPASGSVKIGSEVIMYTGKSGDELTGITRGSAGTNPREHEKNADVTEVGDLVILMADHSLGFIDNIRILASDDTLGEPYPEPHSVDTSTSLVKWSETPRVRSPNAEPVFKRVHFNDVGTGNQAVGARFSARESPAYRAFGVAQLGTGKMILSVNTEGLGIPGDLQRVWIAAIFDPETLGLSSTAGQGTAGGSTRSHSTQVQGVPGNAYIQIPSGNARFNLQPTDLVPYEIARWDEKTGDRIYEVPDPNVDVKTASAGDKRLIPNTVEDGGTLDTAYGNKAQVLIDDDEATFLVHAIVFSGDIVVSGSRPAIYVFDKPPNIGSNILTSLKLVFVAGADTPPFSDRSAMWRITIRRQGKILTELITNSEYQGAKLGYVNAIDTFSVNVPLDVVGVGGDVSLLTPDTKFYVEFDTTGAGGKGFWAARDIRLEAQLKAVPPTTTVTLDPKGSVTNYFDVTSYVGLNPSQKDPAKDWEFFADPARGAHVTYKTDIMNLDPQIIETFYVVEYVPFLEPADEVPRVYANVEGLVPLGNPADVSEAIITGAPPLGMGLTVDSLARSYYVASKSSTNSDGIRVDFAVREQTSAVGLLQRIASQSDCRQTWEDGRHKIIRRPEPDVSLPVFKAIDKSIVRIAPPIAISRSEVNQVITRIQANYKVYPVTGDTSKSIELFDSGQEANARIGRRATTVDITLVRDDTTASAVTQRKLDREKRPRWSVSFVVPLEGLELRFGDLVSLDHPEFSFSVGEVVGLNFTTSGFKQVKVDCVVWYL